MAMKYLSFNTLSGRLIWLVSASLLISQLILTLLFLKQIDAQYDQLQIEGRVSQIIAVIRALEGAREDEQDTILDAASDEFFILTLDHRTWNASAVTSNMWASFLQSLTQKSQRQAHLIRLNEAISDEYSREQAVTDFGEDWQFLMIAAVPLNSGEWLHITMPETEAYLVSDLLYEMGLYFLASLIMIPVIIIAVNSLTAPLARLAKTAEQFGCGDKTDPLPLQGTEEIQKATSAFNQMSSRLQRYSEDRDQMLAAISHDLRSPLTGLRIQAEFVEDKLTREAIIQGIDEMQDMTQAILDFSRDESQEETSQSIELNHFIADLVGIYQQSQQAVSWVDAKQVYSVKVRPVAFKRALRNVIDNALKYGHEAIVSVHKEGDVIHIHIDDKGQGIPVEKQEYLFKPFTRLDESRSKQGGGTGLGLSVARSIMRGMGGDVELQNRVKHNIAGLRVIVSLPSK